MKGRKSGPATELSLSLLCPHRGDDQNRGGCDPPAGLVSIRKLSRALPLPFSLSPPASRLHYHVCALTSETIRKKRARDGAREGDSLTFLSSRDRCKKRKLNLDLDLLSLSLSLKKKKKLTVAQEAHAAP